MRLLRLLALPALTLACGLWLGGHPDRLPQSLRDVFVDERVGNVAEATDVIEDNYFKRVGRTALQDHSIAGMVEYISNRYDDRFSHYFNRRDFERFQESTSGQFSGVGLSVSEVKAGLRVAEVFPGSPAARAGIDKGDLIVSVNGRSIAGDSSTSATARIKGRPGTRVRLGIRELSGRRRTVRITRAQIDLPVTRAKLVRAGGHRFGHVRLAQFTRGSHGAVRQDVERLYKRGAEGIVFDLRGNGGGLLTEAVLVTGIFQDKGVVVTTRRRGGADKRVDRVSGDAVKRKPLVVLVDRDSASASEIVTASLREHGLAPVVGDCPRARRDADCHTFGKGVFQQVIELDGGGALDLTVGQFFTPKGRSLTHRGVRADVRSADRPKTRRDEALDSAVAVLARKLR